MNPVKYIQFPILIFRNPYLSNTGETYISICQYENIRLDIPTRLNVNTKEFLWQKMKLTI